MIRFKVSSDVKKIADNFKELTKTQKRKVLFFSVDQIAKKINTKAIRFLSDQTGVRHKTIRERRILKVNAHIAALTITAKDRYMDLSHPDFKARETKRGVSVRWYRKRIHFQNAFMIEPNRSFQSNKKLPSGAKIVVKFDKKRGRGISKLFAFNPANEFIKPNIVEPLQKEFNENLLVRYERKLQQWTKRVNSRK